MSKAVKLTLIAQFLPLLAFAQQQTPGVDVSTFARLIQVICTLVGYAFALLIVLAVIFVIYAAFLYLTAAGDPEKVKKANSTILYAAIAVAVALLAKSMPFLVASILQVNIGTGNTCGT